MFRQVVLIDAFAFIYRAYYALPDLRTADNRPTGAVRGMINMLEKLRSDYKDALLLMVYDPPGKTFRDQLYDKYKAQRPPMPDDLRQQLQPIRNCVAALGIPAIEVAGYEADDVIGTIASRATATMSVIIASGDKDMAQLVGEHVLQYNPLQEQLMDAAAVSEKFGVPPEKIIDYLAIVGDTADNIPGIPGVGPKTAVPLLTALDSVEGIYAHLDKIAGFDFRGAKKLAEKIAPFKEQAQLSKQLATICTDVALGVELESLQMQEPNSDKLAELYRDFEFKQLLNKIQTQQPQQPKKEISYQCVTNIEQWQVWVQKIQKKGIFAFDTETTSLNELDAELVGFSIAVTEFEAAYIPVAHDEGEQLNLEQVITDLKRILADEKIIKVAQNIKYDLKVLDKYNVRLKGLCFDTMLLAHLLNSSQRSDMDTLALRHLDHKCTSFKDIAGTGKKQKTFNQITLSVATHYAAEDADITLRLFHKFKQQLDHSPQLLKLYRELDWPLVDTLVQMEMNGVKIDVKQLEQLSFTFADQIIVLETQAYQVAEVEFNLGSPSQLANILYQKLGLPVLKKTPKGDPSTAEEVLEKLAATHPLPSIVLQHRSLSKLRSTYTTKLVQAIHPQTNRVHSSFHQAVASTGRLSSTAPNVQNIPIRHKNGRLIRKAFIANSGCSILAADYSQIELRIMAHISRDQNLIKAFASGEDIHRATAAEVFHIPLENVDSEQRRRAKAVNFGLIYGMSAFGLAKQLGESQKQAQNYIKLYFNRYPSVLKYMDDIKVVARKNGFVETILGRKVHLPTINDKNANFRKAAERTAINAPMQGSAADIIKLAMLDITAMLQREQLQTKMTMQVHDELVFEVPHAELDYIKQQVQQKMEAVLQQTLTVPLIVEIGIADNWNDAH